MCEIGSSMQLLFLGFSSLKFGVHGAVRMSITNINADHYVYVGRSSMHGYVITILITNIIIHALTITCPELTENSYRS